MSGEGFGQGDGQNASLEQRVRALEVALRGAIDGLAALSMLLEGDLAARERLTQVLDELPRQMAFGRDLFAFFGPLLAGKTPPLNGDDVATRAYVDAAIERLAQALRRQEARRAVPRRGGSQGAAPARTRKAPRRGR